MIDYPTFCRIHQLRDQDRLSFAQIAAELGLHPETVSVWTARPTYQQRKPALRASKLDPFKGTIARLLERHPYSASQLLSLLREEGYTGGASILRHHVARVRPRTRQAFLRLQFAPGQAAQVDWGSAGFLPACHPASRLQKCPPTAYHPTRVEGIGVKKGLAGIVSSLWPIEDAVPLISGRRRSVRRRQRSLSH